MTSSNTYCADGQHYDTDGLTIQLLAREDLTVDDAETTQERWTQYIESYVLVRCPSIFAV